VVHDATDWWVPAARRVTVHCNTVITPFVRYGDLIGRVAVVLVLAVGALALLPKRWRACWS
jgi:hypothetical protein